MRKIFLLLLVPLFVMGCVTQKKSPGSMNESKPPVERTGNYPYM